MNYSETLEETTAKVKELSDIVRIIGEQVNLKRSGVRYLGLCPFHQEKTPSFSVHSERQYYYCFGCGASGDVFSFMMDYHHFSFPEALKVLADRLHITLPERKKSEKERESERRRQRLFAVNKKAADIYRDYLLHASRAGSARAYLKKRGIEGELAQTYLLGYAPSPDAEGWGFLEARLDPDEKAAAIEVGLLVTKEKGGSYDRFRDRIMFPILDGRGRITGFGGRILGEGNPKYLNSPESGIYNKSQLLFGLYQQREAIRRQRRAVLVEGNFDLLSLAVHGFLPVVAPLGTALTREQIRHLKPLVDEITILFDGDEAGLKAAERSATCFLAEGVNGRVAVLPPHHDPDSFIREKGLAELQDIVGKAEPLPEFVVERLVERHGLTLAGKTRITEELKPLLAATESPLQRSVTAAHFAGIIGVEADMLITQLVGTTEEKAAPCKVVSTRKSNDPRAHLHGALKSLVAFMVLHPAHFQVIADAGAQEVLTDTIGEIIFLQLKRLHEMRQGAIQPETLLTALPEGEERELVMAILLDPVILGNGVDSDDEEQSDELSNVLIWLERERLRKQSDRLMSDIGEAQKHNDFGEISRLMQLKTRIDSEIKQAR